MCFGLGLSRARAVEQEAKELGGELRGAFLVSGSFGFASELLPAGGERLPRSPWMRNLEHLLPSQRPPTPVSFNTVGVGSPVHR